MNRSAKSEIRFLLDFAPLEEALAFGKRRKCGVLTPEMMIVELRLTPKRVAEIERRNEIRLPWFAPAYWAMRRHGLLRLRTRSWERWLAIYHRKRGAIGRAHPAFSFAEAEELHRQAFDMLSRPEKARVRRDLSELGHKLATAKRVTRTIGLAGGIVSDLRTQGKEKLVHLVKENPEHLGSRTTVTQVFGISGRTLAMLVATNRVICASEGHARELRFPLCQFVGADPREWVQTLISSVGNGAPAIHFLLVPRLGLNTSLSGLVLSCHPDADQIVRSTIQRLLSDWGETHSRSVSQKRAASIASAP